MIAARAIAAALVLAGLAGCSSVTGMYDRMFGGSRPVVKAAPLPPIKPTAEPRIVWQANVGSEERSIFFPAVTGEVIYAAGAKGQIAGFNAKTGKALMRV